MTSEEIKQISACPNVVAAFLLDGNGKIISDGDCQKDYVPENVQAILQGAQVMIQSLDEYDECRVVKLQTEDLEYQLAPEGDNFVLVIKKLSQ